VKRITTDDTDSTKKEEYNHEEHEVHKGRGRDDINHFSASFKGKVNLTDSTDKEKPGPKPCALAHSQLVLGQAPITHH
jgi:hypothetical protein